MRRLWKAAALVSAARDLALETRRFRWDLEDQGTFFLQAEQTDIRIAGRAPGLAMAKLELPASFGWQWKVDQDEAGLYIVIRRKPVIGGIARARIQIELPRSLRLSLKLRRCALCLDDFAPTYEIPPASHAQPPADERAL